MSTTIQNSATTRESSPKVQQAVAEPIHVRQPHISVPQFERLAQMIQATTLDSNKVSKSPSRQKREENGLLRLYEPDRTLFIKLPMFLERLLVLGLFDVKHLAAAFCLAQRFTQAIRQSRLELELCPYRTFSVALLIAHKYLDDLELWPIGLFSKICGIEDYELLQMEVIFCERISFRAAIAPVMFIGIMNELYSIEPINLEKYSSIAYSRRAEFNH